MIGKPINDLKFPAITICPHGNLFPMQQNAIEQMLKREAKKINKDLTIPEDKDDVIQSLFPGITVHPFIFMKDLIPGLIEQQY